MDTNNNNKQCDCNKPKVVNDLLKRISNLEFEVEDKQREIERLNKGLTELDNMFYETFRISQNGYYSISEWEIKEFTDKIKELKGSSNNE